MPKSDIQRAQNLPVALLVTILYTAILLSVITSKTRPFDNFAHYFNSLSAEDGIFIFLSPVISIILSYAFANNLKEMLVFWRLQEILPGHRAFTEIMTSIEPHVVEDHLRTRMLEKKIIDIDELPTDPAEQNAAWYKIYRTYVEAKDEKVISRSNNYVMLRDSATIACVFLLFGTLGLMLTHTNVHWIPFYVVATLAIYLLLASGARNGAKTLVHYVLYRFST
jgi:hypothetical protein